MKNIDLHITADRLRQWNACTDQYKLFVASFPNGVTLTRDLLLKHAPDFELEWLAYKLLSPEQWEAYKEASAPAAQAYEKACDTAMTACRLSLHSASDWAAYVEARDIAVSACNNAIATAKSAYSETCAYLLADALFLP